MLPANYIEGYLVKSEMNPSISWQSEKLWVIGKIVELF
jgi:hypothetical protein